MRIRVKFHGILDPSGLSDPVRETVIDFPGGSARELLDALLGGMNPGIRSLFLTAHGELSPDVAVTVNGLQVADSGLSESLLTEGDVVGVTLMPGL